MKMYYICPYNRIWPMNDAISITPDSCIRVGQALPLLHELLPAGRRTVVLADSAVIGLYRPMFAEWETLEVDACESAKTLQTATELWRKLLDIGADRTCFILGAGGGITTDMAGFVASTYMRGVDFGFLSTTLLGQVDASIGGKNGVNLDGYKNMVGTFSLPKFVVCDTSMLRTLPDRELRAGLAETVKAAVIGDQELFEAMESVSFGQLRSDEALLGWVVERAIRVKAGIVEEDCREHGRRRLLNLGHTLAHAIEKSSGEMNHGEAVAVGLRIAAETAERIGMLSETDCGRIVALLRRLGFELELPVPMDSLLVAARKDKKRENDGIHLILPTAIGDVRDLLVPLSDAERLFAHKTHDL